MYSTIWSNLVLFSKQMEIIKSQGCTANWIRIDGKDINQYSDDELRNIV